MERVSIPYGTLAEEIQLACESHSWADIQERLRAEAPNEACVFVLTEPSRGVVRTTAILREPIWPRPGDVRATPYSLEIHADYISRAMDAAVDSGEVTG